MAKEKVTNEMLMVELDALHEAFITFKDEDYKPTKCKVEAHEKWINETTGKLTFIAVVAGALGTAVLWIINKFDLIGKIFGR